MTLDNMFVRGTVTTSQPIINATQTWNAGGVTFAGVKIAISNTASAAASLPFQVLGGAAGATNLFSVRIDGLTTVTSGGLTVAAGTTSVQALTAGGTVTVLSRIVNTSGDLDLDSNGANLVRINRSGGTGGFVVFAGGTLTANLSITDAGVTTFRAGVSGITTLAGTGAVSGFTSITLTGLIQTTLTTEQMRLRYDATYYLSTTVASDGKVTWTTSATSGGNQVFTFGGSVGGATIVSVDGAVKTAANVTWDLGAYSAAGVALDATHYVAVTIAGVAYKLGVVT